MKKLVNDVHAVIRETLEGFTLAHPNLVGVHYSSDFVTRHVSKIEGKVGLVSGDGSGHEPLHTGFVGEGMLDATAPGAVFTLPTPDPILEATKAADHSVGVLHIVRNYTSDVLDLETATKLTDMGDIKISSIVVNDDTAVRGSSHTAGHRGIAGTIFVEEIAGVAAKHGDSLEEVAHIATKVNDQARSTGLALDPYMVSHADKPSFDLGEDETELGIGIHGGPGYCHDTMETADNFVAGFYERVREDLGLAGGKHVVALVNGIGDTPAPKSYACFRALAAPLRKDGIKIACQMVGGYVTSPEMPGVSVTLTRTDDELLELLNAPVNTVAWK